MALKSAVCALTGLILASVCGVSPLQAKQISHMRVAAWSGGAFTEPSTNRFSHCAASTVYKSGIIMLFSINRLYRWSIGFANPAWKLQTGTTYSLSMFIDSTASIPAQAQAIGPNHVEVALADSTELFAKFRRGRLLQVAAAGQTFFFNLDNTSQLLPELLRCVQQHLAPAVTTAEANPFNNAPTKQASTASAHQAEAVSILANILSAAGVSGFEIAQPETAKKLNVDAAWTAGQDVAGTIMIIDRLSRENVQEAQSILIGKEAKTCAGKFLSGALPDDSGLLFRVFTNCITPKGSASTYYLGVPRKAGGAYVMSTVSMGSSEKPAEQTDSSIRSAVFQIVK